MSTEWFKNAVIYHILIDRFAGCTSQQWDQPKFIGGTIRAISEKLDYIRSLGVNTLWISPFYKTSAYHGYHITDFFETEPRFGSEQEVQQLIDTVHAAGMKIVVDFVPNHCSRHHPYFLDARQNPDSPYRNWFYFTRWPDRYLCFLSIRDLPKLNLDNPETCNHILAAARKWLVMGFDGYRLDHCIGPGHNFWKIFRREIKHGWPDCVLIGEAWLMGIKFRELKTINVRRKWLKWLIGEAPEGLFKEYFGELDGVLDFKFQMIMRHFAQHKISKEEAIHQLTRHYRRFPSDFHMVTFLDNHDMDRFLFTCEGDKTLLKEAARIQFSIDQPKIIYYGTEAGLSQEHPIFYNSAHGDLQARRPMEWGHPDQDLLAFYRQLIRNGTRASSPR
jgi:glycosidase